MIPRLFLGVAIIILGLALVVDASDQSTGTIALAWRTLLTALRPITLCCFGGKAHTSSSWYSRTKHRNRFPKVGDQVDHENKER
jgi:hypothetical protein